MGSHGSTPQNAVGSASLQFVQERLRHHHGSPVTRALGFNPHPRVTRRFAIELGKGETTVFERVDDSVQVICARGSVWITHDGDCKDLILVANECYRADREESMHLFALQPSVLEIEFEDDVLEH